MHTFDGFNSWLRRSVLLKTALLLSVLFLFGCGSTNPNDQTRAVRPPSQKPDSTSAELGIGDLYAVVVGVAKYASSRIPQLKFADKDARDFADFLVTQKELFRDIHLTLLLNEQASQKELKKRLYYEMQHAGKNDTVILFFAGHGADDPKMPGEFFFLTHDADPDFLEATSVNMSQGGYIRRIDSKRVVVIADTCFAGGFSKPGARGCNLALEKLMNDFKQSEGRVFLTSSRPDEISREEPNLRNGIFTHYLLEGLKGKAVRNEDGVITLKDAYDYAYDKTLRASSGGQHPQWAGVVQGRFPVSLASLRINPQHRVESGKPSLPDASHDVPKPGYHLYLWLAAVAVPLVLCLGFVLVKLRRFQQALEVTKKEDKGAQAVVSPQISETDKSLAAKLDEMEKLISKLVLENQAIVQKSMNMNAKQEETESVAEKLHQMEHQMATLLAEQQKRTDQSKTTASEPQDVNAGRVSELEKQIENLLRENNNLRDAMSHDQISQEPRQSEDTEHLEETGQVTASVHETLESEAGQEPEIKNQQPVLFESEVVPNESAVIDVKGSPADLAPDMPVISDTFQVERRIGSSFAVRALVIVGAVLSFLVILHLEKNRSINQARNAPGNATVSAVSSVKQKRDLSKDKALIEAAMGGELDKVKRSLAEGADINAKDLHSGYTALHLAAFWGHVSTVQFLLDSGADVNPRDVDSETPLHKATRSSKSASVVKLLLLRGADVSAKNYRRETALEIAKKGRTREIEWIIRNHNVKNSGSSQKLSQPTATASRTTALTQTTVKNDPVRNAQLIEAARSGDVASLSRLLSEGADPNVKDYSGKTPLDIAALGYHWEVVRLIQSYREGQPVTSIPDAPVRRSGSKDEALIEAARSGNAYEVKRLISEGANVNTRRASDGWAPLIPAAMQGHGEVVKVLLENGADVNGKDIMGRTALAWAVWNDYKQIIELLLAKGADVNARDQSEDTALMLAIDRNSTNVVRLLLDNGAAVNVRGKWGYTPLQRAVSWSQYGSRTEIVNILKNKGGAY